MPTQGAGPVYLDSNVLIYLCEGRDDLRQAASALIAPLQAEGARFITSELAFTEVLVHALRARNGEQIKAYEQLLGEFVEPLPVSREVLWLAAQLRAETPSQRTPDAIHVATATLAAARVFITGDRGIRNLPAGMRLSRV
jgi:predicted nucleic acid-binding protein